MHYPLSSSTRGAQPLSHSSAGAADPFTGPPIFLSGCNRGGTTILSLLLASHPEVRNIGRSQFNEGQYIWRQKWPDWSRHRWALPPWRWYLRRDERHATQANLGFFRTAFSDAMPEPGRLLEKTPANALRIPFINALYPNAYFVHIIRDGRDTTASLMARKVAPVYAPHQWVQAHRVALADLERIPEERKRIVRYEELLEAPEETLRHLCRGCGLAWDAEAREQVLREADASLRPVDRRWEALPGWVKSYTLRVISGLQQELGYPLEP